ncbi:MAG: hypothetical protein QXT00_08830 [Ignisphaera sp.]
MLVQRLYTYRLQLETNHINTYLALPGGSFASGDIIAVPVKQNSQAQEVKFQMDISIELTPEEVTESL